MACKQSLMLGGESRGLTDCSTGRLVMGIPFREVFLASPGNVRCAMSQLASSPLQPLSAVLQYLPELQRAAALLAFQAGTQCTPYKQLFDDARVRRGLS